MGLNKKVNIYCVGCYFEEVWLSYDILYEIMMDNFVGPDDFIKFRFGEGERGAIRKKISIVFVNAGKRFKHAD